MLDYRLLTRLFPTIDPPQAVQRIVLIRPCCIGDVMIATPTLKALRDLYPAAHITWAVAGWSRRAIEWHDLLDDVLDTGPLANPARQPLKFARLLRAGQFDMAVSLVRSPLMSAAVRLSGIRYRAGLDSLGRGFGYNIRAAVDPSQPCHEADIFLCVVGVLGGQTDGYYVNVPVLDDARDAIRSRLADYGITGDYVVINPNGGNNPGMTMDAKRWPHYARLANSLNWPVVMIGGPDDAERMRAITQSMAVDPLIFAGDLPFPQIAALASAARGYIGNDTGLTHLAAGTGVPTVMILGPSDPARYGPYAPNSLALWKPTALRSGGVSAGTPDDWDWNRDGISADEVIRQVNAFLA